MHAPVPDPVTRFREGYRATEISPRYRGWAHFAFTTLGSLTAITLAILSVHQPSWLELSCIPITFLVANVGEYFGHRGPMHHRRRGLALLHQRHTLQHHRFFTHESMECRDSRDFKMILFPPVMLVFFLGMLAAPVGALLWVTVGQNVGALFVATAVAYFLTYEWLHFAYHLPRASLIARLPWIATLRRLHQRHHDPAVMTRCNFNITFPICDHLFGTAGD